LITTDKACATAWEISINNTTDKPASDSTNPDQTKTAATEPAADRWTIKRLLDWTTDYFRDAHFDQPRLDAEVLLAEALDCKRIELYTRFDQEPPAEVKGVFRDWVARHAEGEPVAYLVGHKEFFSLKFQVNSSVLIPRPESEHLVTEALDAIKQLATSDVAPADSSPIQVVDVGTGSGCVAVAIAKHAGEIELAACDICPDALQIARTNAANHQLNERIRFVESDLLQAVTEPAEFHLIVSNPPYIGLSEQESLDKSVVDFEPHRALFSDGQQGTEIIQRLVQVAAKRLHRGGYLMFELSPMIAARCQEIVEETEGIQFDRFVNDLAGRKRILIARRTG